MHVYEGAPKFSIDPSHSLRMCVILSFFCILAHYFDVSCFSFWGLYCFSISSIWLHFYDFFPSLAAPISVHTVHSALFLSLTSFHIRSPPLSLQTSCTPDLYMANAQYFFLFISFHFGCVFLFRLENVAANIHLVTPVMFPFNANTLF